MGHGPPARDKRSIGSYPTYGWVIDLTAGPAHTRVGERRFSRRAFRTGDNMGDIILTTSEAERDAAVAAAYRSEGAIGHCYPAPDEREVLAEGTLEGSVGVA